MAFPSSDHDAPFSLAAQGLAASQNGQIRRAGKLILIILYPAFLNNIVRETFI